MFVFSAPILPEGFPGPMLPNNGQNGKHVPTDACFEYLSTFVMTATICKILITVLHVRL